MRCIQPTSASRARLRRAKWCLTRVTRLLGEAGAGSNGPIGMGAPSRAILGLRLTPISRRTFVAWPEHRPRPARGLFPPGQSRAEPPQSVSRPTSLARILAQQVYGLLTMMTSVTHRLGRDDLPSSAPKHGFQPGAGTAAPVHTGPGWGRIENSPVRFSGWATSPTTGPRRMSVLDTALGCTNQKPPARGQAARPSPLVSTSDTFRAGGLGPEGVEPGEHLAV